uniref:TauD/TfdA-like domain-containing protein n=1 Tax=Alexandrium catenella TaxID=2925 RepID=A0A7S1QQG1_ALECA
MSACSSAPSPFFSSGMACLMSLVGRSVPRGLRWAPEVAAPCLRPFARLQHAHFGSLSGTKAAVPLAHVVPRDGSRHDVKLLPSSPELLRLPVKSIARMSPGEEERLAYMLDEHGAVVLQPQEAEAGEDDGTAVYDTLDRLFGSCVPHDAMNARGVVVINPAKPTSINTADTAREHLPHTDDAYTENPAMFCTLQCRTAAPSGGGETVLISGVELLAALSNQELKNLMRPGMVSMGRRPAADASWLKVSNIPMFWVDQNSGWLQLRWRCQDGCVQDVHGEVARAYAQMDEVARGEVHQLVVALAPGEVLVVDNRAVAHGRRPYEAGEARVMWRKNYQGDSEFCRRLRSGLCAAYSSMFDGVSSMFELPYQVPEP